MALINVIIDDYFVNKDKDKLRHDLRECYCIKNVTKDALPLKIGLDEVAGLGRVLQDLSKDENVDWGAVQLVVRSLKNASILNGAIQNAIVNSEDVLRDVGKLLREQRKVKGDCLKTLVIFLLNLSVNNGRCGERLWSLFKDDFMDLVSDELCLEYTLSLIYNVMVKNKQIEPPLELINEVLRLMQSGCDSEYLLFLLEHFMAYLCKYHKSLKSEYRSTILQVLKYLIPKEDFVVPKEYVILLVDEFKKKSDCILKTVTDYLDQIEPTEVAHLLDVLVSISCIEKYLSYIQYDRSFLINCTYLLKSMHLAGKKGKNNFSAISKLSDEAKADNKHPAFGFKASLIRLIGNLSWKSRCNQDELRELECIPLLLDCCNIDERNPFIIQVVVFAIRNLCERNEANQAVIQAMNKQGVVDAATLNQLGITLDDGEKTIRMAPLPRSA